jgi:hypothetical protein
MRTLKAWLVVAAIVAWGPSCGGSTDAAPAEIDHLEIRLNPVRPFYPVNDLLHVYVIAVARDGSWLRNDVTTWRTLTPTLAGVEPSSSFTHDSAAVRPLHGGDAIIEAEMAGVTARITIPIHGLLHDADILDFSETWLLADTPHVVKHRTEVDDVFGRHNGDTVKLVIEPGSVVRFRPGAGLIFGDNNPGALIIPPGAPVVMEADIGSPPSPSWLGLSFRKSRSQLRNLVLRDCGATYPYDHEPACVVATGGELLIDGVTIRDARNGVYLGGMIIDSASRNLSVFNTTGYVATVAPMVLGTFPRGGQFSGNDDAEIRMVLGSVTRSANWSGLPLPLRLTSGAIFDDPSNPILTLPAGFSFRADPGASLSFPTGGLRAGEIGGAPVTLESTGDGWYGIVIEHGAMSELKNVILKDCGTMQACLNFGPATGTDTGIILQDVVIQGSRTTGLAIDGGGRFHPSSRNLTITGSARWPLTISTWALPTLPSGDYRGNGIDAIPVRGALTDSMVLHPLGVPYRFADGLTLSSRLFIDPGVTIEVGVGSWISTDFGGTVVAVGTASEPIVFRSVTPGVPGSWMGFQLGSPSAGPGTRFEHVIIADAGAGPPGYAGAMRLGSDAGGLLRNSTIIRSASCALILGSGETWTDDYTNPAFGNTFTDIAGPLRCQMQF